MSNFNKNSCYALVEKIQQTEVIIARKLCETSAKIILCILIFFTCLFLGLYVTEVHNNPKSIQVHINLTYEFRAIIEGDNPGLAPTLGLIGNKIRASERKSLLPLFTL